MTSVLTEFIAQQNGDAREFVETVQNLIVGLLREQHPKRLYVVRIDNWFGPRWLRFAGKVVHGVAGIWFSVLRVPPFVPHRVISERMFAAPSYEESAINSSLHIECRSAHAVHRKIADIDKDAVFVWFSSESEAQGRGAVMVYLPAVSNESGFYAGYADNDGWQPSMLRYISRSELEQLTEHGRAQ